MTEHELTRGRADVARRRSLWLPSLFAVALLGLVLGAISVAMSSEVPRAGSFPERSATRMSAEAQDVLQEAPDDSLRDVVKESSGSVEARGEAVIPPLRRLSERDANDELSRIGRQYARVLTQYHARSPLARGMAQNLVLQCTAVKLYSQGRAEPLIASGSSGMGIVPPSTENEMVFAKGGLIYRFAYEEFPLYAELDPRRPDGLGGTEKEGVDGALLTPNKMMEVEQFMKSSLSQISQMSADD